MLKQMGKRIRAARIANGFDTAVEFAELLGVDEQRYRRYELGTAMPPPDIFKTICEMTDRTADFFLFGGRIDK